LGDVKTAKRLSLRKHRGGVKKKSTDQQRETSVERVVLQKKKVRSAVVQSQRRSNLSTHTPKSLEENGGDFY